MKRKSKTRLFLLTAFVLAALSLLNAQVIPTGRLDGVIVDEEGCENNIISWKNRLNLPLLPVERAVFDKTWRFRAV